MADEQKENQFEIVAKKAMPGLQTSLEVFNRNQDVVNRFALEETIRAVEAEILAVDIQSLEESQRKTLASFINVLDDAKRHLEQFKAQYQGFFL